VEAAAAVEAEVVELKRLSERAALLLLLACACSEPATQIAVVIDADEQAAESIFEVDYLIRGGTGEPLTTAEEIRAECASWPRVFALAPAENDAERSFEIEVTGRDFEGLPIIRAVLRAQYAEGQIQLFDYRLTHRCTDDVPCIVDGKNLPAAPPMSELRGLEDMSPPRIDVSFPSAGAIYLGGPFAASALLGDRSAIAEVSIQNAPATATCRRVHRSLNAAPSVIFEAADKSGTSATQTQTISLVDKILLRPRDLLIDGRRALVSYENGLAWIELDTGEILTRSEPGDLPLAPHLVRSSANRIFGFSEERIFELHPETLERTPLTANCVLSSILAAAWDSTREQLILAQRFLPHLYTFDPRTGDCAALPALGELPIGAIRDLSYDAANDRLFLSAGADLLEYDVLSATFRLLTCTSGQVTKPTALNWFEGKLWLIDEDAGALLTLDPSTNTCVPISAPLLGRGHSFTAPSALELTPDAAWILDPFESMVRVERSTGDRSNIPSRERVGFGPPLAQPVDVKYSPARDEILILARRTDQLLAVNPRTGERRVLSGASETEGIPLTNVDFFDVAPSGELAAVTFRLATSPYLQSVLTIDLTTGRRTLAATSDDGQLAVLSNPLGVTIGPNGEMYVADSGRNAIVSIGLVTHERFDISATMRGGGPNLIDPIGITYDLARDRLIVTDRGLSAILAVDLDTGQRDVLLGIDQNNFPGSGPLGSIEASRDGKYLYFIAGYLLGELDLETLLIRSVTPVTTEPPFFSPAGAAFDLRRRVAYVIDGTLNGLYLVDLESGARVIMSR
jgi:hypothetical protein